MFTLNEQTDVGRSRSFSWSRSRFFQAGVGVAKNLSTPQPWCIPNAPHWQETLGQNDPGMWADPGRLKFEMVPLTNYISIIDQDS